MSPNYSRVAVDNGKGRKRVEITGLGDKRQITAVFAGALSDAFLKPQVIYKGTTDTSHPQIRESLKEGWDITYVLKRDYACV